MIYTRWCWACHKPHRRFTHWPSCVFCRTHVLFPFVHFIGHTLDIIFSGDPLPEPAPEHDWQDWPGDPDREFYPNCSAFRIKP